MSIIQDVSDFIGSASTVFGTFFSSLVDLVSNFSERLGEAFSLIVYLITYLPNIIVGSMFSNLPLVFQHGITSLFSIFILLFILKLFQLIKFW